MVQGAGKCAKYCLFLVNLLFVLAGIILLVVGVMTKNGFNRFGELVEPSKLNAPANLFIIVGAVVFIIAFLGCCGAVKENHCMMMTYSVLIGLILILEIGAAVTAYYMEDDLKDLLGKGLTDSMEKYGDEKDAEIRKTWDAVQSTLHCCGVESFHDWFNVTQNSTTPDEKFQHPPTSCCIEDHAGCSDKVSNATTIDVAKEFIWTDGCLQKGLDDINIGRIGTVGISLAVIELLAIMTSCYMARKIRFSYETV